MLKGCDMESPHSVNSPRRTLSLSRQRRATVSFPDPNDRNSGFGLSGDHDHGPKPSEVYGFVGSITTVVASGLVSYPPFYNFMIWENIYRYYSYKNITLILFNLLISNICNGENNKKKFWVHFKSGHLFACSSEHTWDWVWTFLHLIGIRLIKLQTYFN